MVKIKLRQNQAILASHIVLLQFTLKLNYKLHEQYFIKEKVNEKKPQTFFLKCLFFRRTFYAFDEYVVAFNQIEIVTFIK